MNLADYAARVLAYVASTTQEVAVPAPAPVEDARAVYAERQAAHTGDRPTGPSLRPTAHEPASRRAAADEQVAVDQLMDLTAVFGPWEAARLLFTPNHGRTTP